MSRTTDNEIRFMRAVADSEYRSGDDLTEPVWMDCLDGWEPQAKAGTVASLLSKGLIGVEDYEPGSETVWLTDAGVAAIADVYRDEHGDVVLRRVSADELDDDTIHKLRSEAASAGDTEQVELCDQALLGDTAARAECARVIEDARAQYDEEDGEEGTMRKLIAERRTGSKTIAGTEWPVVDRIEREQLPGRRPTWIVTRDLVNGMPHEVKEFRTLREAKAAWDDV